SRQHILRGFPGRRRPLTTPGQGAIVQCLLRAAEQAFVLSDVIVQPVRSWFDRRAFLKLPWEIYRGDPNWIPPLIDNQKRLLGWKYHPFREVSEVQTFLARRDGRVVGRIAGSVNHEHNHHYHERRGFFGFFESIDDEQVARA